MQAATLAEATAIIRPSGNWSIHLGPASVLPKILRRQCDSPALERRMGMLASCAGSLAMTALEERGILTHVIRVTARSCSPARTVLDISIECEAAQPAAQACCEARLRAHPLFAAVQLENESVEIAIATHSSVAVRIP